MPDDTKTPKSPSYWLMKSEPFEYSWDDLVEEGEGVWSGVRNHSAKLNLKAMEVGDECFFYHSREGLEIVGICVVSVAGIGDPTDETGKWAAVKVKPKRKFDNPVSLKQIKSEPRLADCELVRMSRLSVAKITPEEWDIICQMAQE
ncbi:EVE domain-containing protein [Erythrobacter sp. SCSIO 43205]|uniref:EVE domain-containing protein n=1 Tax=Erythrobacter sp. SCSIO 43205 TaxID=2779361 RepID=UPI0021051633|nr:EVE domain-containing protein [Erythrobacter sp. SCSIO 43205]